MLLQMPYPDEKYQLLLNFYSNNSFFRVLTTLLYENNDILDIQDLHKEVQQSAKIILF